MSPAEHRRQVAASLAVLGLLAQCAVSMFVTSCNSAPTVASCGSGGPGFRWAVPVAFAPGVAASAEVCLGGAPSVDLDIQRFTVSADGLELGAISSDARCLRFPFTLGATDATVHVQAEVEFPRSALCGSFTYDTSSDFEIRVREPDSVLRFEPRGCDGRLAVLLVGSVHGFDYELGVGGQPLSYGDEQPPLLLDTGALALQDDGRFRLPDAPGPHTATSLIAGDDFERTLIAYAPDEIVRLELGVSSNNEDNTRLVIRMKPWLESLPTCDAPPGIVSVEVMTPTTCHIVVDTTTTATTAEVTLGNGFELAIVDPATSECVVHAAYGDVTGTFSWPLP